MIKKNTSIAMMLYGLVALSLAATTQSLAEEIHFRDKTPTVNEFVNGLRPQLRFRGIRPTSAIEEKPTISMETKFAFDSYELSKISKTSLNNLITALKDPLLNGSSFIIEGHTDAVGPDNYNIELSHKRAASVKRYLVEQGGINPGRLRAIGKGEAALLDQTNPFDSANRRVAIVNAGK
jgi:outer membrane protein OmpA-like peptidoglycan-associated protein